MLACRHWLFTDCSTSTVLATELVQKADADDWLLAQLSEEMIQSIEDAGGRYVP